ncbi:MAG: PAS domain-containing protein, partial [Nitrospinota bacterium]
RVNYNNGKPAVVPADRLQFKGNRYYFKETIALKHGELFVSPFDLNVEHGEIEQPIKPMIRFGSPVFDGQGNKRGIILLNFFGEKLLANLRLHKTPPESDIMLLNSDGYWLFGPKPEDTWGFMYEKKKDRKFGRDFPDAWSKITDSESGQFENKNGIFTFDTVYPIAIGLKSSRAGWGGKPLEPSGAAPAPTSYYWKIVSRVPAAALSSTASGMTERMLVLYFLAVGILAISLWVINRFAVTDAALGEHQRSPMYLLFITAVSIFSVESMIMIAFSIIGPLSPVVESLLDSSLLILLVSPFLYFFLFRPLVLNIAERQRAEEEIEKAHEKLSTLYAIDRAGAQTLNLEILLNDSLDATIDTLNVDGGAILLSEPDGETLTLRAYRNLSDEFADSIMQLKRGEGISGKAVAEKKAVALNTEQYPTERLAPYVVQEGFKTMASAPILSAGKMLGAVTLATRRPQAFLADELELISSIGIQLGSAVYNAQLFEEVQNELTERQRAEEELRQSKESLARAQEIAHVGSWEIDIKSGKTKWSDEMYKIYGYKPGEVVPTYDLFMGLVNPDDRKVVTEYGEKLLSGKWHKAAFDIRIIRPDGEERIVHDKIEVALDETGKPVKLLGINFDITERRQAEETLRESEE